MNSFKSFFLFFLWLNFYLRESNSWIYLVSPINLSLKVCIRSKSIVDSFASVFENKNKKSLKTIKLTLFLSLLTGDPQVVLQDRAGVWSPWTISIMIILLIPTFILEQYNTICWPVFDLVSFARLQQAMKRSTIHAYFIDNFLTMH